MYMYGMHSDYIILILITLALGCFATWRVNSRIKKYSRVPTASGLSGAQAARAMLCAYGISGVEVRRGGTGQDFFDPRSNSVTLSSDVYDAYSVTAFATACHEVGHACQYAQGYIPMKVRSALVPVANMASNAWVFLLVLGIFLHISQLTSVAIIMYAAVVLFQLATLPVEFNASRRAMVYMDSMALPKPEQKGASSVLRACAFTYVAAALTSVLQLLWLLGQRNN